MYSAALQRGSSLYWLHLAQAFIPQQFGASDQNVLGLTLEGGCGRGYKRYRNIRIYTEQHYRLCY